MKKHIGKRMVSVALCTALLLGGMTACDKKQASVDSGATSAEILNFTELEKGEQIVVMTLKDRGDVTFRLFPEQCPKGVENFLGLIEKGYYDELIFHRVIQNFVIQGGDPKGNGTGGDSLWGEGFAQEITSQLRHFTGALAYAVGQDNLNKSQFYVVTGDTVTEESFAQLQSYYGKTYSDRVKELYYQYGGQPYLDGGYEVFGQVIGGLDLCLEVDDVEVGANSKPKQQVQIERIVVKEYDGSAVEFT